MGIVRIRDIFKNYILRLNSRDNLKTESVKKKYKHLVIFIVSFTLFALSCISPFEPKTRADSNMLVVDGSIIKGFDKQEIKISRASPISDPVSNPVTNCQVKVVDDSGNEFVFSEESQGKYVATIDDGLLNYNNQYKLVFSTPLGENYESDYQRLLKTAQVDSFYCAKELHYSQELKDNGVEGLQFYTDLNAPDDDSKYYKWQINETWELYASNKIFGIYDGKTVKLNNWPEDSLYYCYKNRNVIGFYTSSTVNLSHNIIKKIPLIFKLSESPNLATKYCATLRQFALNKEAYEYWHQKEIELTESGQIYTKQPFQNKSNITNINDPGKKVLGFFWASSCSEKHLFLRDPFGKADKIQAEKNYGVCKSLVLFTDLYGKENIERQLLALILRTRNVPAPPLYIFYGCTSSTCYYYFSLTNDCVDCRLMYRNSTNKKPDFWR